MTEDLIFASYGEQRHLYTEKLADAHYIDPDGLCGMEYQQSYCGSQSENQKNTTPIDLDGEDVSISTENGNGNQVENISQSRPTPVDLDGDGVFISTQYGDGHQAVDIAAPIGTPVVSVSDGTVMGVINNNPDNHYGTGRQGNPADVGNWVRIINNDGSESQYAHLDSINVEVNDQVATGDIIGTVGNSGYSTGPHLHYLEKDEQGNRVNPKI